MLSVCTGVQASGLVPIVEPEVLLDGEHDIDATLEVAQAIWAETFKYLADNNVRNLLHPAFRWAHVHPLKCTVPLYIEQLKGLGMMLSYNLKVASN